MHITSDIGTDNYLSA